METLTKVELTENEALMFIQFQKRYSFMQLLENMGAFDIKDGSIHIHFDRIGRILSVDKKERYTL